MALEDDRKLSRAPAAETVDSSSVPGRLNKPKAIKVGVTVFCLLFSIKEDIAKPSACVVGKWAGGSLT